jgi:CHAD domain-containing protein
MKEVAERSLRIPRPTEVAGSVTDLSGAVLLHLALGRYATNFLLNDLASSTHVRLPALVPEIKGVHFVGRAPVRRESAVEQLHHSRVSVRRTRSAVRIFDDLFDPAWSEGVRADLSWYGRILGEARDLEVMREHIVKLLGSDGDAEIGSFVVARVDEAITGARHHRDEARLTDRYRRLLEDMSNIDTSMRFRPEAFRPANRSLRRGLKKSWRAVDESYRAADQHPTSLRLHQLRIDLKRLQYAGEIVGLVAGDSVSKLAQGAESLQTKLGKVHDHAVARRWIDAIDDAPETVCVGLIRLRNQHLEAERVALRGWHGDARRLRRRWREIAR